MSFLGKLKSAARRALAASLGGMLRSLPLSAWKSLAPKDAVGLCYHMVSEKPLPHLRHYPFLTPAEFEADLAYVEKQFGFLSYDELIRRRAHGRGNTVRGNKAILTFDDGFAECAQIVAPILKRKGIPAVFFLITDLIDNKIVFRESMASLCIQAMLAMPIGEARAAAAELGIHPNPEKRAASGWVPLEVAFSGAKPDPRLWPLLHWLLTVAPDDVPLMERLCARLGVDARAYVEKTRPYLSREQARRLAADGFTLGAHSLSHRRLQSLAPEEAEREIAESCRLVAEITGQASVPFAFPYFGGDMDRGWLKTLRARHAAIGLFFDTDGLREDAPFVVQRVFSERVGRDKSLDRILRRAWARPSAWMPGKSRAGFRS
ncbi:MAG TPA: polysaccharide deacetylase family protein [Rhizomicrobium sp.]|nr:polysaccharide deacetylase family protein [Rhizomicrobium sp.]